MTTASRHQDTLASHAVCAAAGARDSVRTAQFFLRILSGAEYWGRPLEPAGQAPAVHCEVCGQVLIEWGSSKVWIAQLVARA